jgi:F-type H+-transporting ATPase subunit c
MKRSFRTVFSSAVAMLALATPAFAQEAGGDMSAAAMSKLGAAIAIGVAAGLCGLGQGKAVAAACDGTARNPAAGKQIFTLSIVGLALIESLAIYALVIAIMLFGKVPS